MPDDMLSRIEEHFHVLHLGEESLDLGKVLSGDTSIKVLDVVYNSDPVVGLSASEISKALGVGRTTVIYHLGRMQENGLVRMHPILENDANWKKFWDLYRKKRINISKDQFNKLHNAKMNGVKLFLPTKKGFLVLPSTDVKAGQSMVEEALASLTAPVMGGEHQKMVKSASILGILGLLFIAFSFMLPGLPFFWLGGAEMAAPVIMEKVAEAPAATMASSPSEATAPPIESQISGSSAPAAATVDSEDVATAYTPPATMLPSEPHLLSEEEGGGDGGMGDSEEVVMPYIPPATTLSPSRSPVAGAGVAGGGGDGGMGGGGMAGGNEIEHLEEVVSPNADVLSPATTPPGKSPVAEEPARTTSEERTVSITPEENASVPTVQPAVLQETGTPDGIADISRALSYAGTLLLGSVLGLLFYSYIRRR